MKKLRVQLHKSGSENDVLTRLISNYNEGKGDVSPRDIEGYLNTRNAMFPTINNLKFIKGETPNEFHISEDGGKSFTMSIEWLEVYSLPEVDREIEAELNADDLKEVFN